MILMEVNMANLTIGKLAKACDVNIDTIRYYEGLDLLVPEGRTASGYRVYNSESLNRLKFIRQMQRLDFTLDEIKEMLALRVSDAGKCADVRKQAEAKITLVEEKEKELKKIKKALKELVVACENKDVPASECPILEILYPKG
ncbi:MAG: heavy metal-responsive transcriptional regulator [Alphaproteobacteria bacterium]|nr:heavy metal-responsive transcriptional regulator [Alphaproteobacteria bacterium]